MKKKILLFGPMLNKVEGAYGGGDGGYTRKMNLYLHHFQSEEFEFVPCYHTVAGHGGASSLVIRFLKDITNFIKQVIFNKPDIVHILAQYRKASPREFGIVLLSNLFNVPVVYEIKAGVFHNWYPQATSLFRYMLRYCIQKSKIVLCQGMPYVDLIQNEMQVQAVYFPNFVPAEEIPQNVPVKLSAPELRVLFVGYAFADKGVFELVEGCNIAAIHTSVVLTLIGKEHPDFATWLDQFPTNEKFKINRMGRQSHDVALSHYRTNDIYCYPTRHIGEGHNNSINEAMMYGMVIVTTRQGFMESVLGDTGYFIDSVSSEDIAMTLIRITDHREEAKQKSLQTRKRLMENFTDNIAFNKLHEAYRKCLRMSAIS